MRCASEPHAATRPPAKTTASTKGSGAITLPISSATTPISVGPAPLPPRSSGNGSPSTPMSASFCHISSSKPGSSAVTVRRFSAS